MGFFSDRKTEIQEAARQGDTKRAEKLIRHTLAESDGDDVIEQMKSVINETKKEER